MKCKKANYEIITSNRHVSNNNSSFLCCVYFFFLCSASSQAFFVDLLKEKNNFEIFRNFLMK